MRGRQGRRVGCPAGGADRAAAAGRPDDGVEEETYVLVTLRISGGPA
ncbi:hypothetical protein V6U77_21430 [Micromonospora sp. CPCC 205546]